MIGLEGALTTSKLVPFHRPAQFRHCKARRVERESRRSTCQMTCRTRISAGRTVLPDQLMAQRLRVAISPRSTPSAELRLRPHPNQYSSPWPVASHRRRRESLKSTRMPQSLRTSACTTPQLSKFMIFLGIPVGQSARSRDASKMVTNLLRRNNDNLCA
jgi:hypothetical protein